MIKLAAVGATLAATALVLAPAPASAAPDTACQKAGIKTLQAAGLLDDVARGGLPISTALDLEVGVRDGADLSGVPDPLPLSLILADHRAGSSSLFTYPWCE
ncbi:MAG TPA: hypothetical protein VFY58_06370 [Nocardioides sp.]|nr:hypothetical protein [Nocardioides sp.]